MTIIDFGDICGVRLRAEDGDGLGQGWFSLAQEKK